jgi:hypothetical protein
MVFQKQIFHGRDIPLGYMCFIQPYICRQTFSAGRYLRSRFRRRLSAGGTVTV